MALRQAADRAARAAMLQHPAVRGLFQASRGLLDECWPGPTTCVLLAVPPDLLLLLVPLLTALMRAMPSPARRGAYVCLKWDWCRSGHIRHGQAWAHAWEGVGPDSGRANSKAGRHSKSIGLVACRPLSPPPAASEAGSGAGRARSAPAPPCASPSTISTSLSRRRWSRTYRRFSD